MHYDIEVITKFINTYKDLNVPVYTTRLVNIDRCSINNAEIITFPKNDYYIPQYNGFILYLIENVLLPEDSDKILYKLDEQAITLLNVNDKHTLMLLDKDKKLLKKFDVDELWEKVYR